MLDMSGVLLALRAPALAYSGLPLGREWTNEEYIPVAGVPYVKETFIPATSTLKGLVKQGLIVTTGLYVLTWFALANSSLSAAPAIDGLLALYPPGLTLFATDGTRVRIRGDIAPWRGVLTPLENGRTSCLITVPWSVDSYNS